MTLAIDSGTDDVLSVVKEALAAIADGKPRLLDFGVSNEQAWEVGLACGGKVQVFVERVE
jgi:xanthine/CO dehydrogenase XdhC/CoxF family maturation factor